MDVIILIACGVYFVTVVGGIMVWGYWTDRRDRGRTP